jgi:hypothetical protein
MTAAKLFFAGSDSLPSMQVQRNALWSGGEVEKRVFPLRRQSTPPPVEMTFLVGDCPGLKPFLVS